jgi:Thermolysin metallopeptidase, alpha-helical domain/Thermolysin metallopeptidase, catalytic domain/Emfourin
MSRRCTFVPPYVLEALAVSGDPHLEAHAAATLATDAVLRRGRGRRTATIQPEPGSPGMRIAPGTPDGPQRSIYDAAGSTTLPGTLVRAEGDPPTGDTAVGEAYDGLGDTWRLWREAYGRNSLDGRGLPLLATVHYGRRYDNAFWDGTRMVFGDGDGVVFLGFTRSLDVIGHELAHGVTQFTSGLNYQGQSGALNESVSDVFGVLVTQYRLGQSADEADWLVGADLLAPDVAGVALRSMAAPGTAYDDPRLGSDPQPAHLDDYVDTTADNGGVHINSGIPNKAFHVVATTLGGFAWERAGQVWYDTITGDIRADCDFTTFAGLTLAAAVARYGPRSEEAEAVRVGWDAVGLAADTAGPRGGDVGAGATVPMTPPDLPGDRWPPGSAGPAAEVSVRRTGGVTGVTRERTVSLERLPEDDARAWQRLLADDRLHALARAAEERDRQRPDAFCYTVACSDPQVEVDLPEPAVPDEVRELLERTLVADGDL